ncbi:MAG TPA: glycosyl hydrolase, partial [Thermoanaerobaculia bacterium]|nr:glycosyl hydrolase [Thermoanaerobaculia bacterium]
MRPRIRAAVAPLVLAVLVPCALAVTAEAAAKQPDRPAAASIGTYDESLFQALDFRLVGPFRGGRSTAVTGVPGQPRTFYMGSTGGGVWKTTDGGATWRNVSDRVRDDKPYTPATVMGEVAPGKALSEFFSAAPPKAPGPTRERPGDAFGSASVGAIAVAPSDPNVVYVGMGSACIRGNVSPGDGVYKSTDGGETWHHLGLSQVQTIGKIRVHPKDPDLVYIAALGHAFGPNPERGVFRSTDGGHSWRKVLYVSDDAGAIDLVMDPSNPRVLYAAMWEARRQPWTMISGGKGSGIYKSIDGGDTWRQLSEGLPPGPLGRIGLALSPASPSRLWALVEAKEKWGVYRSDDGGKSFRNLSTDRNLVQRAWYYTHIFADPKDASTVYVLNTSMWRSEDGGKTFTPIRTPHGDNHDLWINPDDPQTMIESNDGGANVTMNGGRSWSTQANQPTAEIYRVTVDDQFPYWMYGGQQDNSAVAMPSRTMGGGVDRQDWYIPGGCESAYVAVNARNPRVTYAGCYGGSVGRYDRDLGHEEDVSPWPQAGVGQQAKDLRYRFQWNQPIRSSPHDPQVVYTTSQVVHRSRDEGKSWEVISADLTRNDPAKQGYSGGPITWDNTGVEVYDTIFAFEESPLTPGELWAGSDDGLVHLSRDNGAHWTDITPKAMPEWATVNSIELSRREAGRAYLAVHRYRLDDFRPYIFRTDDYGKTWQLITDGHNGIPANHWVRVVREDPDRPGLLYAGTEFGLYASFDAGRTWQPFQVDLPVAPVADLAVKNGDLVVATHGRSFWVLDDLSPVRQLTPDIAKSSRYLFAPRDAVRLLNRGGGGEGGAGARGDNPPYGASIFYLLPEDLSADGKTEVKLEILDADGKTIRTLSSQKEEYSAPNPFLRFFPELARPRKLAAHKGLNRFDWNLQLPDAFVVQDAVLWGSTDGPVVPPGKYQVKLTVGDWSSTQPLEVRPDPRKQVAPDAFAAQYRVAKTAWEQLSRTHRAIQ